MLNKVKDKSKLQELKQESFFASCRKMMIRFADVKEGSVAE